MLSRLEMRIGEKEEEGGQRVFWEVVGHELHGVCADDGNVLIRAWCTVGRRLGGSGGRTECDDSVVDILGDLDADFHA